MISSEKFKNLKIKKKFQNSFFQSFKNHNFVKNSHFQPVLELKKSLLTLKSYNQFLLIKSKVLKSKKKIIFSQIS